MSQTGSQTYTPLEGAKLDIVTETRWLDGYEHALAALASSDTGAEERAAILERIDRAAIPIESAGMQADALLSVAGAVAKDYHAGLIGDAEVQAIMQAGHQALRDGLDDETLEEHAIIAARQDEITAAKAELDAMAAERGELAPGNEEAARANDALHAGIDIAAASIELVGDGRNALGDAARAMAEARGELPNADGDLLARQLDACDRLREADEAVIDAYTADVPMMHELVDVASDAYRDGTIWPGMDDIYAEQVLHDRIEQVREEHGREPAPQHNERNEAEPVE